jgi:hypothetical protein
VILEERVSQRGAQLRGDFDEASVALPGLRIEELPLLLFWQALLSAGALFVLRLVLVAAPVNSG